MTQARAFLNVQDHADPSSPPPSPGLSPELSPGSHSSGISNGHSNGLKQLRRQPFAEPAKVQRLAMEIEQMLNENVSKYTVKMRLYLSNETTINILYEPIKENIMEIIEQFIHTVKLQYALEDKINLPDPFAISCKLDYLK